MTAIIATALIVAYLLIPNYLFRTVFSYFIPIKQFERNTVQELFFTCTSTLFVLIPAIITVCCVYPVGWSDYKMVFSGLHSTEFFAQNTDTQNHFWASARPLINQNCFLIGLFYFFVCLESYALGYCGSKFALYQKNYGDKRWFIFYKKTVENWIFPNISEFYLLFTTFLQPEKDFVWIDIMTVEDHLYRGKIGDYFLDKEGQLSGLLIIEAQRFRRGALESDRAKNIKKPTSMYWERVVGAKFYFPADKMLNYNLSYLTEKEFEGTKQSAENEKLEFLVSQQIEEEKKASPANTEKSPQQ